MTGPFGEPMSWRLDLPYTAVPLSMNSRPGVSRNAMFARARTIAEIRRDAGLLALAAGIPRLQRFSAELHYEPRDNRRRDTLNLAATLKPLVDGLVDAGVCDDDDTKHYVGKEPVIHPARKGHTGRMWLIVTDLGHLPGTQTALNLEATREPTE